MIPVHVFDVQEDRRARLLQLLRAAPGVRVTGTTTTETHVAQDLASTDARVLVLGIDATSDRTLGIAERVMSQRPTPILLVWCPRLAPVATDLARWLDAGAVEGWALGEGPVPAPGEGEALLRHLRVLAGIRVVSRHHRAHAPGAVVWQPPDPVATTSRPAPAIIGIGASTGGPQALGSLLGSLPQRFATPIAIVQHINTGFSDNLLNWFRSVCPLRVELARDRQRPQPGHIYLAPDSGHLTIDADGLLACLPGPARNGHLPAIDTLFESLAQVHGARACGVLLTGMGRDGAAGLLEIRRAGGATLVQDEASCAIFGMPAAAIALSAAELVTDLAGLARALIRLDKEPPDVVRS